MNRAAALLLLSLVVGGCAALPRDERGVFTGFNECSQEGVWLRDTWSHCSARVRPWGQRMEL
jgi:hypothetical protein